MGKGIALEAKKRFPDLPKKLGKVITEQYDKVHYFPEYSLYTFPTKYDWWKNSDIDLILQSARNLAGMVYKQVHFYEHGDHKLDKIYMVKPGCSNGKLEWDEVKPVLAKYLDNGSFVIVDKFDK
jgi:hypothetical protein